MVAAHYSQMSFIHFFYSRTQLYFIILKVIYEQCVCGMLLSPIRGLKTVSRLFKINRCPLAIESFSLKNICGGGMNWFGSTWELILGLWSWNMLALNRNFRTESHQQWRWQYDQMNYLENLERFYTFCGFIFIGAMTSEMIISLLRGHWRQHGCGIYGRCRYITEI